MVAQTKTPIDLLTLPDKQAVVKEFVGRPIHTLRTPCMVIDRAVFAKNCAKMHQNAKDWGASFRAHVKSHKTAEGTKLQLVSSTDKTEAVVVSTLMEAWAIVKAGLVADGTVKDILYGLPVGVNKIQDLASLWDELEKYGGIVRLLIDHPEQVQALEQFEQQREKPRSWSVFVKVDGGQKRAGVPPTSTAFRPLVELLSISPATTIFGFYCHAWDAYASTSLPEASSFLSAEVNAVNSAASAAKKIYAEISANVPEGGFVLAVGSTPTAHAASVEARQQLDSLLHGRLELHAGNYPLLDLQQMHTNLVGGNRVAQKVLATVISYYPGRSADGRDEALCDAGAIAMSKDTGPSGGFGDVIGKPWRLGRVSQEHGILLSHPSGPLASGHQEGKLAIGEVVEIVGQHACLITAAYPWYYIVDSEAGKADEVVDVWVSWKGW
ncbi:hypothetical protein GLOTRDRAFT_53051 [Gloeophyllum trabeum ATCC 11539]|uniref:D-serine dehydratase n=1 Tax=Gloeophyllum trabeum (strain ATCC 11539 / FP-39264 / Madison 617) TaxID=670483 RepID=S7S004_GLOTA|nr:uncharacterized protein GLOTRDRAFT_53051 [Gloeophyllum trabeum ATCC 11539]EPQ60665.1 hypothetical protein GLOTRDRAFT_53051 [Gloeophyllum trabeum ATCC 11539]